MRLLRPTRLRTLEVVSFAVLASISARVAAYADGPLFIESATETGLDFVHFNGMSGELYLAEVMGAGLAVLDYDGDGDLDVFCVQGTMLGGAEIATAIIAQQHPGPLTHRLYRNDLEITSEGTRRFRFTDVTNSARLPAAGYGMGVATGDYDNDGDVDLYVTQLGANQLLRNDGDGTFSDATRTAGVDDLRWSVPAVFFDYDRDGWLDLFVGNYVDFRPANHHPCTARNGAADYCGPDSYRPEPDRLFRNRGDGSFEDVTVEAGIEQAFGAALGAASADFDSNGWPDLYVANDQVPNQLWLNRGDGTFTDSSLLAGVAVNRAGLPEASMGVVTGDLNGNGASDLFLTHLRQETNTMYSNDGGALFEDLSVRTGLGPPSLPFTGFGIGQADFDADGLLDLYVANGAVTIEEDQFANGDPLPLRQPNQLYRGGGETFSALETELVAGPEPHEVSRGVSVGDLDNDGDPDLVVSNNSGPVRMYLNQTNPSGWWGIELLTGDPPRPALGAGVTISRPGKAPLYRWVASDGSYASAQDPRILIAGTPLEEVEMVRVTWPSGRVESFSSLVASSYTRLVEGKGSSFRAARSATEAE